MRVKINEEKIKSIEAFTLTDYQYENGSIPVESVEPLIDDMLEEIYKLTEQIEELHNEIKNNYKLKEVDPYEFNGISINEFI